MPTADEQLTQAIQAAAHLLADRGLFGLVWFDEHMTVTTVTEGIASFVAEGSLVTQSVLPLFGFEDQILALRRYPKRTIEIPNIALVTAGTDAQRMNLHVFWHRERRQFLLLLTRAAASDALETQLYEENRRRMLAEEEVVRQAAALQQANGELTRANRDLTEFAYVISHDLNAPLRALRYFAEDLERALTPTERTVHKEALRRIDFQSHRMSAMLADLLAYSRIGRKDEAIEDTDTSALAARIVQSLPAPEGLRVEIAGGWPTVRTYPAPLDLVLRNLVHNAIKHHDTGRGRIEIHCAAEETSMTITVTDDGPGIEPRFQEAIFQPFCKLEPDGPDQMSINADATASGIGLALVRRTAEVVGARIEVRSDPAKSRGTAFLVHWPTASCTPNN